MTDFDDLLTLSPKGLYCPAGGFYLDPWQPVSRAVITHAHSDHARWGSRHYLAASPSEALLRMRLGGGEAEFAFLNYGETIDVGGVRVSFHPAGHMLGSAQVRLEYRGRVAVVTGDYKLEVDPTCTAWEPVRCDLFVTESTFALPIYRWQPQQDVFASINRWWRENRERGRCSLLYGYAVGKSQRLLAGLDPSIGPIYTHGAVEKGVAAYRQQGVELPDTIPVGSVEKRQAWAGAMVLAVPSAHGTPWMRRFGTVSTAMASGWMMLRGTRRRRATDRGFALSDHIDWPGFLAAVEACDPERVWVTHGYTEVAARHLREQGRDAIAIETRFGDEESEPNLPDPDIDTLPSQNE